MLTRRYTNLMLRSKSIGLEFLKCPLSQVRSDHRELGILSERAADMVTRRLQTLEKRKDLTTGSGKPGLQF